MRLFCLAVAFGAFGALLPTSSQAFVRSTAEDPNVCLFWNERTIPWTMNERGLPRIGYERSHAAFERAFATWADVSCTDISFQDNSPSSQTRIGFQRGEPGDNLVIFRLEDCSEAAPPGASCHSTGTCANEFDCWSHGRSVIAVTTTTFIKNTGEVLDADIEMNAAWFDFTDTDGPPCADGITGQCVSTDIQNTATHEIGHLLGLDHTSVTQATMFASAPKGEIAKRQLSADDEEGVCSIYPFGQPAVRCDDDDRNSSGCDCQSGGGGVVGGAGWLLLAFALLRRMGRAS